VGESIGEDGADDRAAGAGPRSAGHRPTRVRRPAAPPSTGPATESAYPADPTRPSTDPLVCHPDNPCRPPDWRWERAASLADGLVCPSRRRDDAWVVGARRFLTDLRRCRDEGDREALTEHMPDFHAAFSVYADAAPQRRWALEAYLMSAESFDKIAHRFGVGEGAIAVYEKTFFDVLDHLDTDFVPVVVIGLHSGSATPSPGAIWKLFAYHGGPQVLEFVLGMDPDLTAPLRPERFGAFAENHVRDELLKKVAAAALTLPFDGRSAPKLMDVYLRGLKDERRDREPAPTLEAIRPNVVAMWGTLPPFLKRASVPPTAGPPTGASTRGHGGAG